MALSLVVCSAGVSRPGNHRPYHREYHHPANRVHLPGLALTHRGRESRVLRLHGRSQEDVVHARCEHDHGYPREAPGLPLLRGDAIVSASDVIDLEADLSRPLSGRVALGNPT